MLRDEYNRTAGRATARLPHRAPVDAGAAHDSRKYGLQGNTKARISQAVLIMTHFGAKLRLMVSAERFAKQSARAYGGRAGLQLVLNA